MYATQMNYHRKGSANTLQRIDSREAGKFNRANSRENYNHQSHENIHHLVSSPTTSQEKVNEAYQSQNSHADLSRGASLIHLHDDSSIKIKGQHLTVVESSRPRSRNISSAVSGKSQGRQSSSKIFISKDSRMRKNQVSHTVEDNLTIGNGRPIPKKIVTNFANIAEMKTNRNQVQ